MVTTKRLPQPINIISDDPEVMFYQSIIRGLKHFAKKDFTMRHFKVLMAVKLAIAYYKLEPTVENLETVLQLTKEEFQAELNDLVQGRYLHKTHPTFGKLVWRYKLGSMGGTVLRQMTKGLDLHKNRDIVDIPFFDQAVG